MSISWSTIEDKLREWVIFATGFGQGNVIWAEQSPDGTRPTGNLITLKITSLSPVSDYPEIVETMQGTPGAEVILTAKGFKAFTLSLQVFGEPSTGALAGFSILGQCQSATSLPSVQAIFDSAGISIIDTGVIQNVTVVNHSKFESRAVCDFKFYCLDEFLDYTTFIETVITEDYIDPNDPDAPAGTTDGIDI